jgi:transcription antitermination protein NusB
MSRHSSIRRTIYQLLRNRARDTVLQVLYQDDLNPQMNPAVADQYVREELSLPNLVAAARPQWIEFAREELTAYTPEQLAEISPDDTLKLAWDRIVEFADAEHLTEFARALVAGVRQNRADMDRRFEQIADNWSVQRMAVTDRNVLRLGAYEILYTDTPGPVAINEAIELANRFGTAQSSNFVNGILDKLLQGKEVSNPKSPDPNPKSQITNLKQI